MGAKCYGHKYSSSWNPLFVFPLDKIFIIGRLAEPIQAIVFYFKSSLVGQETPLSVRKAIK